MSDSNIPIQKNCSHDNFFTIGHTSVRDNTENTVTTTYHWQCVDCGIQWKHDVTQTKNDKGKLIVTRRGKAIITGYGDS